MKQSKKLVLLVGAIGLVVVFIYGYGNYGLEFGKFFAAEPGVTRSSAIQCSPAQQNASSGSAVSFKAIISPPSPKVVWSAVGGNPSSGAGMNFTTTFTNGGSAVLTKNVIAKYGKDQAICSVTVMPLPLPAFKPLGVPVTTQLALPSTVLQNGTVTLARFSMASSGQTTWLKRIAFTIEKAPDISLNNDFRIFQDGVDMTVLGTFFSDPGTLPGNAVARIWFTFTNEQPLASGTPGHLYEFQALVSGVPGNPSSMFLTTRILNRSGTGAYQPMAYTGGLENRDYNVSLVWTDKAALNHSYTTLDWYSDRNVRTLPMLWSLWVH